MKSPKLYLIAVCIFLPCCSDAGLKGGSRANQPTPGVSSQQIPTQNNAVVPLPQNVPTTAPVALPSPTPTVVGVNIDGKLDGQEIINSCDRCVQRARELSPKAGFVANINATSNQGFYKTDPAKGLCDIHFLPNLGVAIGEHEGFDSVLPNQIALYCPCNCPWARNESNIF